MPEPRFSANLDRCVAPAGLWYVVRAVVGGKLVGAQARCHGHAGHCLTVHGHTVEAGTWEEAAVIDVR